MGDVSPYSTQKHGDQTNHTTGTTYLETRGFNVPKLMSENGELVLKM